MAIERSERSHWFSKPTVRTLEPGHREPISNYEFLPYLLQRILKKEELQVISSDTIAIITRCVKPDEITVKYIINGSPDKQIVYTEKAINENKNKLSPTNFMLKPLTLFTGHEIVFSWKPTP